MNTPVTQFQTIENLRRELLAATMEAAPAARPEKRSRLLIRIARVTSVPCR
jgi:hypothetical protein